MSAEEGTTTNEDTGPRGRFMCGVFDLCCCSDGFEEKKSMKRVYGYRGGCSDCGFLIIFVMFCCIMLLIAVFALIYGNPLRLINGMDSFGNVCGTTNDKFANMSLSGLDMTERPYVFFFDLQDMDTSTKICVAQCPDILIEDIEQLIEFQENMSVNLCRYDYNATERGGFVAGISTAELTRFSCPNFPIYPSIPILKRCIPSPSTKKTFSIGVNFFNIYEYLNSLNVFKQVLGDLAVTWKSVLVLSSFSFVISLVIVLLLHWMTACTSYLIMIVTELLAIGFAVFMWWTYLSMKKALDDIPEDMLLEEMVRNERAFLWYSIIATVVCFLVVVIVLYLRNRVGVVTKLFREAGAALLATPFLLFQPIITYASLTGFFCAWLYIVLCLATSDQLRLRQVSLLKDSDLSIFNASDMNDFTTTASHSAMNLIDEDSELLSQPEALVAELDIQPQNRTVSLSSLATLNLLEYSEGLWIKYLWWIYIFGLVWISEFILGCQQFVVASSVAKWYFTRDRNELSFVVLKSIVRLVMHNLGSIALGSLLITLVKVPRLVLKFFDRVLRKYDQNRIAKCLSRSCACCLNCFENCMRYVHHNAYTVMSIQGIGFCPAARLAFSALVQNALQIGVINSIGDCILFLAKVIAALVTGLIAVVYFQNDETLYFYAIPVLLTVVFAYFVAHCVISVFEMAVDTLFLCFCEDHNMHFSDPDEQDGRQFYAPPSLLRYMTVDAVDAVALGRRSSYKYDDDGYAQTKVAPVSASDRQSFPEESIPMNPYSSTTER